MGGLKGRTGDCSREGARRSFLEYNLTEEGESRECVKAISNPYTE
jgi:hypothetical protein